MKVRNLPYPFLRGQPLNFHTDVQNDNDAVTLLDTLESFGLEQYLAGPTLDLIITSDHQTN